MPMPHCVKHIMPVYYFFPSAIRSGHCLMGLWIHYRKQMDPIIQSYSPSQSYGQFFFFPHLAPPSKSTLMKPLPPCPIPRTRTAHREPVLTEATSELELLWHKGDHRHAQTRAPPQVRQKGTNLPNSGEGKHKTQGCSGQKTDARLVRNPFLYAEKCIIFLKKKMLPPNLLSKDEFSFSKLPPLSTKHWYFLSTVTSTGKSKGISENYCIKT